MAVYKDEKQKTWYVSVRYSNWQGEKTRKVKRGYKTKKEAQEWEQDFLNENAGNLEMTFAEFVEIYKQNQKHRVRESTWQTKESIIETKIMPYFKRKRMIDIKSSDVVAWQNKIMSMTDETGQHYSLTYGLYDGPDELIGVSMGYVKHWYKGTEYFIEELCIRNDYQGKGYGRLLFELIGEKLKEHNLNTIFLMTDRNQPAYRFYQRLEFRELPELTSFYKEL